MMKFQLWEISQKWNSIMQFCLKEGKRALNITKFVMHSYLPNGHLNIWSYFNSKKLVKRETLSCAFTKVALKGSEIVQNIAKVSVYACLLKWVPKIHFEISLLKKAKKCASFQLLFDHPWMRAKIAPNLIKIGVHVYLWNGYLKLVKSETPSCSFA